MMSWQTVAVTAAVAVLSVLVALLLRIRTHQRGLTGEDLANALLTTVVALLAAPYVVALVKGQGEGLLLLPTVLGGLIGFGISVRRRCASTATWRHIAIGALLGAVAAKALHVAVALLMILMLANSDRWF